jgi:hypothetical protein
LVERFWEIGFGIKITFFTQFESKLTITLPFTIISILYISTHLSEHEYRPRNYWQALVALCCGGVFGDGVNSYYIVRFRNDKDGEHFNWLFGNTINCSTSRYSYYDYDEELKEDGKDDDDHYYDDDETP